MKRITLLFLAVCIAEAQQIPGRYIVEFESKPAVATVPSTAERTAGERFSATDSRVAARKAQIRVEHDAAEQSIRGLGGVVRRRFDTLINGMAVELTEEAAARLRQMPGVRGVYPDEVQHKHLDHAISVHKVPDAWKAITGGQAGAGAGIKIGILDTGIDTAHPAFQGFNTPMPKGFPLASSDLEKANTSNKVIVSRDYTGAGGLDTDGHGTGNAMVAAGMPYDQKLYGIGPLSGFAPGAWLGNYRVFDDNGGSTSADVLTALQDAVNDGMNVINYSGGSGVRDAAGESGPYLRTIDAALAAGTLVVVSAGNDGPDAGTVSSPAVIASAIAVGSNSNERAFFGDDNVVFADLPPVLAAPGSNSVDLTSQVKGPMKDVSTLDKDGLGCSPFPAGSLTGQIALILRGTCNFSDKVLNAQNAGAVGAVVYDNLVEAVISMTLDTDTLPAVFVTNDSGLQMKQRLAGTPGAVALVDFSGFTPIAVSADRISTFSSRGPTPRGALKPDITAVGGDDIITASTTQGGGFPVQDTAGTSLAAPMVTGAIAALMSARPGLTAAQYRSLIIDSASPFSPAAGKAIPPQTAGGGRLNLLQAIQNNLTADPPSVNFLTASGKVDVTSSLSVTNVGSTTDTFTVAVKPLNSSGLVPVVDAPSFTLAPKTPRAIAVHMTGANPDAGSYQGYLEISGSKGGVVTRVPYWLGVPGSTAKSFAFLQEYDFTPASFRDQIPIYVRTTDLNGLPVDAGAPVVTTSSPRAAVGTIAPLGDIKGTYRVDVTIGRPDTSLSSAACPVAAPSGCNVFTFTAGDATRDITFVIQ